MGQAAQKVHKAPHHDTSPAVSNINGPRPQSVRFLVYYSINENCRKVNAETTDCSQLERDIGSPKSQGEAMALLESASVARSEVKKRVL